MDLPEGLVIDTSIWINLLATGRLWEVVAALPYTCCAPEQVVSEVRRDPITQAVYEADRHPLRDRSELEITALDGAALDLFLSLVGNDVESSLGDGEAASIAIAAARGCAVALDERKARRVVRQRFPAMPMVMSIELLHLPSVISRLGQNGVSAAVADALRYGRMHIPREFRAGGADQSTHMII